MVVWKLPEGYYAAVLVEPFLGEMIRMVSNEQLQIRPILRYDEECIANAQVEDQSLHCHYLSSYFFDYLTDYCCFRMAERRMTVDKNPRSIENNRLARTWKLFLTAINEM